MGFKLGRMKDSIVSDMEVDMDLEDSCGREICI